jgi:cytochrome c oxidase subunit 3
LLNVPVGTGNTFVLIASSVTVVMAWAALKMRRYTQYWWYMLATIVAGTLFLVVKLAYEWPEKFVHFGIFVRKDHAAEYEKYLGNQYLAEKKLEPRWEITGHLLDAPEGSPYKKHADENAEHFRHEHGGHGAAGAHGGDAAHGADAAHGPVVQTPDPNDYVIQLDQTNANPTSPDNERPHFIPRKISEQTAVIKKEHVEHASAFYPRHSSYFSTYFLITGLHGLHVLGGVIVFAYFLLFGKSLYVRNPEHLANRVEVAGLFWHFVDLVWIFVFPIFYLL